MKTASRSIPAIVLTALLIVSSFTAKAQFSVSTTNETCFNSNDGSIKIHNMKFNYFYMTFVSPFDSLNPLNIYVNSSDTVLTGLVDATYYLHLKVDNQPNQPHSVIDTIMNVTISNHEPVVASFLADSYNVDGSTVVNFTNTSTGANTYFWDFGDNTQDYNFTTSHSYNSTGIYTVKLIASDSNGCSGSYYDVITVNAPTAPGNYFSSRQSYGPSSVPTARTMHTIAATATQGAIHVADRGEVNGNATVTIVNLAGQLISTQNMNGAALNIAVDGNTVYVVTVQYPDGSATSDRIFVTE